MGTTTFLLVSRNCYRRSCLVSDMYAGPVPDNQTCVMVNMSADLVEMMPGQLVGRE